MRTRIIVGKKPQKLKVLRKNTLNQINLSNAHKINEISLPTISWGKIKLVPICKMGKAQLNYCLDKYKDNEIITKALKQELKEFKESNIQKQKYWDNKYYRVERAAIRFLSKVCDAKKI